MMEEPVVKASLSSIYLNSQLDQRMISSAKRDRCIIRIASAESISRQKSRSDTPSMLFRQIPSKPRLAASMRRSVS